MESRTDNIPENIAPVTFYNKPGLFFCLLVFIVLIVSGIATYALHEIKFQKSKEIEGTLTTILHTTHEALIAWAEDHIDDLQYWATRPDVKEMVLNLLTLSKNKESLASSKYLKGLRKTLQPVLEDHGHLGFFIVCPDYMNVASLRDENLGAINLLVGKGDYLERIFNGEEVMTTPLRTDVPLPSKKGGMSLEEPTMFIGVPILDEGGKVLAALLIRLDPSENFSRIAKLGRIGDTGETYLVNKEGFLISESRFGDHLIKAGLIKDGERAALKILVRDPGLTTGERRPSALHRGKQPLTLMARSLVQGNKGANLEGYNDYRGVSVVGVWLWDQTFELGMTTEIDFDEAFRNYNFTRNIVVTLLLFTVLLFFALYMVLMKSRRKALILKREAEKFADETYVANEMLGIEAEERKLAQEELWRESNFISAILDSAAALVLVLDKKGRVVRFNRACEDIAGYSFDEMEGEYIWDKLLLPQDLAGLKKIFDELRFEAIPTEHENSWATKDGRRPLIAWSNSVLKNKKGGVEYIVSIGIDVTEKRAAENALIESGESLSRAQAIAHIGNWEWEVEKGNIFWSDEIFRIFGYEPGSFEPTYQDFLNTIHPDDRDLVASCVAEALKKEKSYSIDHRVVLPGGGERIVHEQGEVEFNKEGRAVRMIGAVQDITEQKKAEEEIQLFKAMMEATTDFVAMADREGKTTYLNKAARLLIGIDENEDIGKMYIKDFHPKEVADYVLNVGIPTAVNKGSWLNETVFLHKDGHEILTMQVLLSHKSSDGEVEYFSTIARDISQRKAFEDELKKAKDLAETGSKAKSEFLANMSHEIRTPMTSIIGMAELLSEGDLTDKERDYVERLKDSGDSLLAIINDILDLSKIEAGRIDLEEVDFNLPEEVEKIISIYGVRAHDKGVKLSKSISPDVPHDFKGDPVRLRQVLINLIGNAIKFTDEGEIRVNVEREVNEDDVVIFTVSDSGKGIPESKLESIFEEFSQADSSTTRIYGGTGLGLTISRKLVELMGGEISVESEVGKGSKLRFSVKMKAGSAKTSDSKKEKKGDKSGVERILNILLVDDSEDNRLLIKIFMKNSPHILDIAVNGEEAFEKFMVKRYDLVLMDMQMPVMDGYEATKIFRSWEEDKNIKETPIIAFTAHALKEEVQRCLDAGCTDHLAKPVKKKELIERIRSYMV